MGKLGLLGLLRLVAAVLCKVIYKFISWLYELFLTISRVNILSSEEIAPIYQRVTLVLTIVMVFYLTFSFVKYVIQPDTINDKEKGVGNIAVKMIVVILLIAFVPKIFTYAYKLQGRIIDNQVIPKVILGKTDVKVGTFGKGFSADIFSIFYRVNEEACNNCDAEKIVKFNIARLKTVGDLRYLTDGLNDATNVSNPATGKSEPTPLIEFDGIFAILVGAVICYLLILYSLDVGTRYAQLVFLQILSPIAIMGYLSPKKDNMFSKWGKQCLTTYLDLFIRIAIIYFILLICQVLGDAYGNGKLFDGLGTIPTEIKSFTYIALILGLLAFASKAPKMLAELFPKSGAAGFGYGLRTPSQVLKDAPYMARALGAAYAGTGGIIKNARKSAGKIAETIRDPKKKGWNAALDIAKWAWRGTVGGVGAGLSGARLGAGATDISGMKKAMKTGYDRTQAKYKIHDVGYAPVNIDVGGKHVIKLNGKWFGDIARQAVLMDENIGDMAIASDFRVQSIQRSIATIQESDTYDHSTTVVKSKATGNYMVYDASGNLIGEGKKQTKTHDNGTVYDVIVGSDGKTAIYGGPGFGQENIQVSDLNSQLGKEQAKNKALHQKENESNDKK